MIMLHRNPIQARIGMNRNNLMIAAVAAVVIGSAFIHATAAQTRKSSQAPALVDLTVPAIAISPDGKQIALVLRSGETQQLHLRSVQSRETKPIAGTEGAGTPFFSPDGKWLAFFAAGKIKKLAVDTGQIVNICDTSSKGRGAVWGSDQTIGFNPD